MSEEKVKEIQEFVDNFTQKLKDAEKAFVDKENKIKKLKKSQSQKALCRNNKKDKLPFISNTYKTIEKHSLNKNLSNNNIVINLNTPIWKPPNFYPSYFEEYKRLQNDNQLSDWQKVCKFYKY